MQHAARFLFVAVAAISLVPGCSRRPDAAEAQLEASEAAELARLRARARELEQALEAVPAQRPGVGTPQLMEILAQLDGPAMSRELEKLLTAGPPGFEVIHEFLHQCDIERQKFLTLVHHPQLVFALLSLVARYPDEAAGLSAFLMRATAERPESYIRREIFNFVPVFLNHHRGRYPELREKLQREIITQLAMGGEYFYKLTLAMRDLGFDPPVASFLPVLLDPQRKQLHASVVQVLAARGEEGLEALVRFLREVPQPLPATGAALRVIAALDRTPEKSLFRPFLHHEDLDVRNAAIRVLFETEQNVEAAELAVDFLNSQANSSQKRALIGLLNRKNPDVLLAVAAQPEKLASQETRAIVEAVAARLSKSGRHGGPEPKPSGKR